MNTPDWLAKDVEANERLRKLKSATTNGHWFADEEQDGEYTGPGDDPPGYAGDWFKTGGVGAGFDGEKVQYPDDPRIYEEVPDPVEVFGPAPRPCIADAEWVAAAHEDDAEGRYDRLLAAYRKAVTALEDVPLPGVGGDAAEFYGRFYDWYNDDRKAAIGEVEGLSP